MDHQVTRCGGCHEKHLETYNASMHGHGLHKSGLLVTAVCAAVRARTVHHAVVAEDDRELVVALAAGEASIDRFGENIVASGGVLTLASLLVPAVAAGPGALRTSALVLGAAVLACVVALVLLRRSERAEVPA